MSIGSEGKAKAVHAALALAFAAAARAPALAAGPAALASVPGWIVFDSKRDGQFDICKMRPDGTAVTRLTDTPEWETSPDWSPDGREIVFSRKDGGEDDISGSIWMMDADGQNQRMLVKKGNAPQFTADGKGVIFERDRVEIVRYDLTTKRQSKLTPPAQGPAFEWHIIKPRISPDGGHVAFVSDKRGRWHSWVMDMQGEAVLIGSGCQPTWHPDGRRIFYIAEGGYQETSVWSFTWPPSPPKPFLALTGKYRHVYFPSVSDDGKWILFAACPMNQHDHSAAHYQIFIAPLEGGEPVRLSRNDYTERWPRLSTRAR